MSRCAALFLKAEAAPMCVCVRVCPHVSAHARARSGLTQQAVAPPLRAESSLDAGEEEARGCREEGPGD